MKNNARAIVSAFGGAALWVLASSAAAQPTGGPIPQKDAAASGAPSAEAPPTQELGSEIVVTATRRNERLQDIPVTVTAIPREQIENLQIKQFSDIQVLSPGLSFEQRGAQGTVTSLRGISSTVTTSAPAAVVLYFNEVPVNDLVAFQSIYDIGQIEVLRGPQGTLRGVAAPVGSITIGTRRPDLEEIGGTGIATVTNQPNYNFQGALNVPIINDRLAIRVAGLYDHNENGDLKSATTGVESDAETKSGRVSLAAQPFDALNIFASYQYLRNDADTLTAVVGNGLGFNGPVIESGRQDLAVGEGVSPRRFTSHLASLNARLDLGQEAVLSYIGSFTSFKSKQGVNEGDTDTGNAIRNFTAPQLFSVNVDARSHEIRVDSAGGNRLIDYAVGVFYQKSKPNSITNVGANTGAINLAAASPPTGPATLTGADIFLPETRVEKSAFASGTVHLPTRTDITLGARRLQFKRSQGFSLFTTTGGVRDTPVPIINESSDRKFNRWVFDARAVQHLNDDAIVYFSYGRGFRGPGANRGVPIPLIPAIQTLPPETSNSYELGFKGDLLDRRVRVSFDIFQQDFKGFNSVAGDVPFCPNFAPNCRLLVAPGFSIPFASSGQVVFAGDARVRGFEAELFVRPADRLTFNGTVSYARSRFQNAQVPFRPDLNGNGVPDTNNEFAALATQAIYFTPSSGPISEVPKWNFTIQSEYTQPLSGEAEAYLRGLFVYRGSRSDVSGANSYRADPVLNLFAGVRGLVDGLELTLFARNIFNTRRQTFISAPMTFGALLTGYSSVNYTPQRELGITARFTFGSD